MVFNIICFIVVSVAPLTDQTLVDVVFLCSRVVAQIPNETMSSLHMERTDLLLGRCVNAGTRTPEF